MSSDNSKHPLDWNAKMVRFFYDNSRLVWLIIISVMLGGFFSLISFNKEGFPAVNIKTVAIQTIYPGAASTEVESKVTRELEAAIKDAKGLKDFSSASLNSVSQIMVNFDESVNLDQAIQDVQNKISIAKANLPKEVEQPKVMTISTGGPAFALGITNSSNNLSEIKTEAEKLATELETIAGIKKAEYSQNKERVVIAVKMETLQATGVSLGTLTQLLGANNLNYPTGVLEVDGLTKSTVSLGSFNTLDDIKNLTLGFNPLNQTPIHLSDIATISQQIESDPNIERFGLLKDGKISIANGPVMQVSLTSDADFIKTKEKIISYLEDAKADGTIGKDLSVTFLYDQAQQTKDQIKEILEATFGAASNLYLLGGIQLLFIAMLLLVNWRAALISALAIPLSFAFTFISLKLTGVQLNTIVLFSLVLILGLVVDPAIVMVEAIQRYRDLKYDNREAVIEAGRRYGASLFMAVLTSLLVFIPFGVVTGYFGQIIRYMPLTIIPALIASYLVPIALLPQLTKRLLGKELKGQDVDRFGEDDHLSRPARFIMRLNQWALRSRWTKFTVLATTLVLIVLSFSLLATGRIQVAQFSKPDDNVMLMIQAQYKQSLSIAERDKAVAQLEAAIVQEKGAKEYYLANQSQTGFMAYVNLKPKTERPDATDRSKEVVSRLKEKANQVSNFADISVDEISAGPPNGSFQIKTQLASNSLENLRKAGADIGKFLGQLEHVDKVDDGVTGKTDPQIQIKLDRNKVSALGLSSYEVGSQIKAIMDESKAGRFEDASGNSTDIVLKSASKLTSVQALRDIPLTTRAQTVVKLGDLAEITEGDSLGTIEHYNGQRFISIQARVDDSKNVLAVQKKLDDYLTNSKLKELGIDSTVNKGDIGDITKSFTDLGIALLIAIVLTYIVLVLQFKSFSQPLIMLFTIPLSLIGVFPVLWLFNIQLGFLELLGITILVGIVENVAIFLIDYANQLVHERGLNPKEAIIQASGVRFRPILLTKLVALGGLLPLAIESDFWRGLSLVIIAGIGLSGFFSLVIIPILYVSIMKVRMKLHRV